MLNTVFVYGTLQQGFYNHRVLRPFGKLIGRGRIKGFKLLNIGHFPAVVKSGAGEVQGELYELHQVEAALRQLDRLEGHPRLYRRQRETVWLCSERQVEAWVYIWQGEANYPVIRSGDYRRTGL